MVEVVFNPQSSYTTKQTNVEMFVSDSGRTKGKMIADTWLMFDRASEPYWYFPDGIYVETFDSLFNVETIVKADTCYHYKRKNLWKLVGHVDIYNQEGKHFQTSELYFDRQKETFYSDSFMRMTDGDKVNTGIGFVSNQDFTKYDIFHSSAEIPVETQRRAVKSDENHIPD